MNKSQNVSVCIRVFGDGGTRYERKSLTSVTSVFDELQMCEPVFPSHLFITLFIMLLYSFLLLNKYRKS